MNVYRGLTPHFRNYFNRQVRLFVDRKTAPEFVTPERGYSISVDPDWRYPMAYGYANVGVVLAKGEDVTALQVGDWVYSFKPHQDYYVADANMVYKLPELTHPVIGIFSSNLNTALNGVMDSNIKAGDTVVIFGQGVVGLLVNQWAQRTSPSSVVVVDKIPHRRRLGLEMGAQYAFDPEERDVAMWVREMTGGRGADVVIEASGSYSALHAAIRTAAYNTTVTAMGFYSGNYGEFNLGAEFHFNRVTIKSSQVDGTAPELSATHTFKRRMQFCCSALPQFVLEPLITECVPFGEAARAYQTIDEEPGKVTQMVLTYE